MYKYFTYGQNIHSNVELPLWPAAEAAGNVVPDIVVECVNSAPLPREIPEKGYEFTVRPDGCELLANDVGVVLVSPGYPVRVEARPLPGSSNRLLAHYLTGSILAVAIHYAGDLALHGCALRIHERTVVFLGSSGAGKSSLCAALCRLGHQVLCDDISPIRWINGRPHVMPGYPQMKVNRDTVDALAVPADELTILHEIHPKSGWFRPQDCCREPQPLDSLFFLGVGEREIRPLAGREAFALVQRLATPSQWGFEGGKDHFLACSRLLRGVPAHSFVRERNLDGLMEQAQCLSSALQVQHA